MTRSAFHHEPRITLSEQQRAKLFVERDGHCGCSALGDQDWGCGRKLGPADKWRVEHGIALENGGTNDWSNLYVSCEWCWPDKDAADHAMAGHARRAFTRHVVPGAVRRSRSWGRR